MRLIAVAVALLAAACDSTLANAPCHTGDAGRLCFALAGTDEMPDRLVPDLYDVIVHRPGEALDDSATATIDGDAAIESSGVIDGALRVRLRANGPVPATLTIGGPYDDRRLLDFAISTLITVDDGGLGSRLLLPDAEVELTAGLGPEALYSSQPISLEVIDGAAAVDACSHGGDGYRTDFTVTAREPGEAHIRYHHTAAPDTFDAIRVIGYGDVVTARLEARDFERVRGAGASFAVNCRTGSDLELAVVALDATGARAVGGLSGLSSSDPTVVGIRRPLYPSTHVRLECTRRGTSTSATTIGDHRVEAVVNVTFP
jgi:hypothetical protein